MKIKLIIFSLVVASGMLKGAEKQIVPIEVTGGTQGVFQQIFKNRDWSAEGTAFPVMVYREASGNGDKADIIQIINNNLQIIHKAFSRSIKKYKPSSEIEKLDDFLIYLVSHDSKQEFLQEINGSEVRLFAKKDVTDGFKTHIKLLNLEDVLNENNGKKVKQRIFFVFDVQNNIPDNFLLHWMDILRGKILNQSSLYSVMIKADESCDFKFEDFFLNHCKKNHPERVFFYTNKSFGKQNEIVKEADGVESSKEKVVVALTKRDLFVGIGSISLFAFLAFLYCKFAR